MISDRFIGTFIGNIKTTISNLKDDMVVFNVGAPSGVYDVGRLQGRIEGLEESLRTLEETYQEQDV